MSLTERLQHAHEAIAWKGDIPLSSRYTVGLAGKRFFEELRDNGRLMGTYCPVCDYIYLPPKIYCERCFDELTEWVEVAPEGAVFSFTVLHLDLEERRLETPEVVALIRLDGADGVMLHRLDEVELEDLYIGMPVEAVFREEREGSLEDISHFRPLTH